MPDRFRRGKIDARAGAEMEDSLKWLLVAVIALALGLRLWGITFGLPYELTNDEGKEIHRALKLGAGDTTGDSVKEGCTTSYLLNTFSFMASGG